MKIRKLRLKGVRCFDDFEIKFTHPYTGEVLTRAVLVGVNGSGKTTILDALEGIYCALWNDPTPFFRNTSGYLHAEFDCSPEESVVLWGRKESHTVTVSIEWTARGKLNLTSVPEELSALLQQAPPSDHVDTGIGQLIYYPCWRQLPIVKVLELKDQPSLALPFHPYRFVPLEMEKPEYSLQHYLTLQNYFDLQDMQRAGQFSPVGPRFGRIKTMIDKVFVNVSKRLAGFDGLDIIVETNDGGRHDINQLSHGEKQMFLLLVDLLRHEPKHSIILIDEPELSLHPQWQDQLIYLVEQIGEDNQIIVATHSTNIATSVFPEEVLWLSTQTAVAAERAE